MSKLTVTVTEQISNVAVTEQVIEVNEATGIGPQGIAGVISATAPVTYNSGTQTVGINAGVANGVATLDSDGKVPTTQLPPLAVNDTFVVASQAAMLALTAQVGDIAVRTDVTKTFILTASPASTLGNWQEILTPPGVTSITATAPLTGGTITSTGSIGLDQTGITAPASGLTGTTLASNVVNSSITKTGLTTSGVVKSTTGTLSTGTVDDTQLTSGVTDQGDANKIVKVSNTGTTRLQSLRVANSPGYGTVEAQWALSINPLASNPSYLLHNGIATNYLPSTSGTLIGTGDTGTVTGGTSGMIASGTITDANINASAAIAQSKIVQPNWRFIPASGVDVVPRLFANATRLLTSQTVFYTAFIPDSTITISSLDLMCTTAGSANSGTIRFNVGIFTVNTGGTKPSVLNCVTYSSKVTTGAATMPAFSAVGTAASPAESFSLGYTTTNGTKTTNGAPTSVTLNAGTTYYIGVCGYASASFVTGAGVAAFVVNTSTFEPYVQLSSSAQTTDFSTSSTYTVAPTSGGQSCVFMRLIP